MADPDLYTPVLPQVLDSTILSTFRSCQTKTLWSQIYGLHPTGTSPDLHAGAAFARGREVLYRSLFSEELSLPDAVGRGTAALELFWGDAPDPSDTRNPKTKENTIRALWSYAEHYGGRNDRVKPLLTQGRDPYEYSFAIPLDEATTGLPFPVHPVSNEPFIYAGKFDLLGIIDNTLIAPLDDKTTKAISSNWSREWDFRGQFLGYLWALRQGGIVADHFVVRGVAIQKTQTVHAEAIKLLPNHLVARWLHQTQKDVRDFVSAWLRADWDQSIGNTCTSYGICPYLDLCIAKNPSDWFSSYRVHRWNPLNPTE